MTNHWVATSNERRKKNHKKGKEWTRRFYKGDKQRLSLCRFLAMASVPYTQVAPFASGQRVQDARRFTSTARLPEQNGVFLKAVAVTDHAKECLHIPEQNDRFDKGQMPQDMDIAQDDWIYQYACPSQSSITQANGTAS